jgi:DNA-binding response OmpR family regulator
MIKLLIVDDSADLLSALKMFLEKKGFTVNTTSDHGRLKDHIMLLNPDLLLMDIFLSGQDGRELCQKLKEDINTKQLCIMLFSASPDALKNHKHYGADGCIEKPFNLKDLIAQIKSVHGNYLSSRAEEN